MTTTLGEEIAKIAAQHRVTVGRPQPSLLDLQGVGPTEHSADMVDQIRQRLSEVQTKPGQKNAQIAKLQGDLAWWERRLAWAIQRDAIAETRPEGCWCLGAGGRDPIALPVLEADEEPVMSFRTFCSCPEATVAAQAKMDRWDRYERETAKRRAERLWGQARVPAGYEGFSFENHPNRDAAIETEAWYAHGEAAGISVRPWLVLSGAHGTGKTSLATALVRRHVDHGLGAVFRTVPDLLIELRSSYGAQDSVGEAALLHALNVVDLLVLDDLGSERLTGWVEERMFALLNYRHNERKRTVITTNLWEDEIAEHLGERVYWRIKAMSDWIALSGRNLREEAS